MFRIGEFSKLSRVSIKMLRHYDEVGLLRPARVDPETGYRYYAADQLPRLNRIVALKDLGFGLEQIARLLADGLTTEQVVGMLKLKRAEIEHAVASQQARLQMLAARLAQLERGGGPAYDVVVRRIEALPVAAIRARVPTEDVIQTLFEELEVYVARHRARAVGAPLTVYHDGEDPEGDLDVEVAVPVAGAVPAGERVTVRTLPAVETMACVVHTGSYGTIGRASAALGAWVEAHGYRIVGPMREVYLRFGADGLDVALPPAYLARASEEYVTELQMPVGTG